MNPQIIPFASPAPVAQPLPALLRELAALLTAIGGQLEQELRNLGPVGASHAPAPLTPSQGSPEAARLEIILAAVCDFYRVAPEHVRGRGRTAGVAWARHVTYYFAHTFTRLQWQPLGDWLGRDRDTPRHSYRAVLDQTTVCAFTCAQVRELRAKLAAKLGEQ